MPENLMCPEHKSNSDEYRREYERIFKEAMSKPEPYGAIPLDPRKCGFIIAIKKDA